MAATSLSSLSNPFALLEIDRKQRGPLYSKAIAHNPFHDSEGEETEPEDLPTPKILIGPKATQKTKTKTKAKSTATQKAPVKRSKRERGDLVIIEYNRREGYFMLSDFTRVDEGAAAVLYPDLISLFDRRHPSGKGRRRGKRPSRDSNDSNPKREAENVTVLVFLEDLATPCESDVCSSNARYGNMAEARRLYYKSWNNEIRGHVVPIDELYEHYVFAQSTRKPVSIEEFCAQIYTYVGSEYSKTHLVLPNCDAILKSL